MVVASQESQAYSPQQVPNVHALDRRQHVSDPNGLLAPSTKGEINRMLTLLEDSTGIQSMVVMLPSIGEDDIFEFGHELFRHWGIGHEESNNGLLVLYVADQRKIRFTTGYGLEGVLPDALCKRIQSRYMVPYFRRGQTDEGMLAGMQAVVKVLDGSMKPDADADGDSLLEVLLTLVAIVLMVGLPVWLIHRQERTCPRCGKGGSLKLVSQTRERLGRRVRTRQTLHCTSCGHVVEKVRDESDHDDTGAMMGGMFMGSMLGGRGGGGGGFMGGSFGGGSTGGGGSTSDW